MSQTNYRWLADENFPIPVFRVLINAGWDIRHIGIDQGGLPDTAVMQLAIDEERILLTFDGDHSTLVFKDGYRPLGIVYFSLANYLPDDPGHLLIKLTKVSWSFLGFIIVVEGDVMRQRSIPA
jgi:predicted nuclease of predicted toxin-antitoxin system